MPAAIAIFAPIGRQSINGDADVLDEGSYGGCPPHSDKPRPYHSQSAVALNYARLRDVEAVSALDAQALRTVPSMSAANVKCRIWCSRDDLCTSTPEPGPSRLLTSACKSFSMQTLTGAYFFWRDWYRSCAAAVPGPR